MFTEVFVEITPAVAAAVASLVVMEFCLDRESGLEELERKGGGVEGIEGMFGEMPNSCLGRKLRIQSTIIPLQVRCLLAVNKSP